MGYLAVSLSLVGHFAVADGRIWGWPIRAAGMCCWVLYGLELSSWPLILDGAAFMALDLYGLHRATAGGKP